MRKWWGCRPVFYYLCLLRTQAEYPSQRGGASTDSLFESIVLGTVVFFRQKANKKCGSACHPLFHCFTVLIQTLPSVVAGLAAGKWIREVTL